MVLFTRVKLFVFRQIFSVEHPNPTPGLTRWEQEIPRVQQQDECLSIIKIGSFGHSLLEN